MNLRQIARNRTAATLWAVVRKSVVALVETTEMRPRNRKRLGSSRQRLNLRGSLISSATVLESDLDDRAASNLACCVGTKPAWAGDLDLRCNQVTLATVLDLNVLDGVPPVAAAGIAWVFAGVATDDGCPEPMLLVLPSLSGLAQAKRVANLSIEVRVVVAHRRDNDGDLGFLGVTRPHCLGSYRVDGGTRRKIKPAIVDRAIAARSEVGKSAAANSHRGSRPTDVSRDLYLGPVLNEVRHLISAIAGPEPTLVALEVKDPVAVEGDVLEWPEAVSGRSAIAWKVDINCPGRAIRDHVEPSDPRLGAIVGVRHVGLGSIENCDQLGALAVRVPKHNRRLFRVVLPALVLNDLGYSGLLEVRLCLGRDPWAQARGHLVLHSRRSVVDSPRLCDIRPCDVVVLRRIEGEPRLVCWGLNASVRALTIPWPASRLHATLSNNDVAVSPFSAGDGAVTVETLVDYCHSRTSYPRPRRSPESVSHHQFESCPEGCCRCCLGH